jgi:RHS repeat-associated protein
MQSPGSQGTRDASTPEIEEVFSLAADPQLAENSRPGSERKNRAFALGFEELKSQTMQWGSWQASGRTASVPTVYLYDGADLLEEIDSSGNVLARYTHGRGVDQPLSMLRGGTNAYYLSDGIRSITSLSNSAGALANTYTYDSFGKLTTSTGTLTNPFQFTAREFDQESGIYYYRARYYDPQIGRFASEDPARFFAGSNFYDYVLNNPTDLVDPTGKFWIHPHGNWCGPDWTGGHTEMYDPAHDMSGPSGPYYNGPIDYTDSVCKDHDICYYDCRRDHKCDKGSRRNCMRQCDGNLIYELTYFPGRFGGAVDATAGMIVTGGIAVNELHPNAGDNDKSCPNCQK